MHLHRTSGYGPVSLVWGSDRARALEDREWRLGDLPAKGVGGGLQATQCMHSGAWALLVARACPRRVWLGQGKSPVACTVAWRQLGVSDGIVAFGTLATLL